MRLVTFPLAAVSFEGAVCERGGCFWHKLSSVWQPACEKAALLEARKQAQTPPLFKVHPLERRLHPDGSSSSCSEVFFR